MSYQEDSYPKHKTTDTFPQVTILKNKRVKNKREKVSVFDI